jgi:hypothetical protein
MANHGLNNLDFNLDAYKPSSDPKIDLKDPLERIVPGMIKNLGPDSYSWEAVLMLLFNHVDFLGHLRSGGSSNKDQAQSAVKFIRSYLGKIDKRYKEVGGLLYYMLRHGLTHKSFPKRLILSGNNILGYTFSNTKKREKHLTVIYSSQELRLKFSVDLFYDDLLSAIDLYCEDMCHDKQLKDDFVSAWEMLREPEDEANIKQKYIEDSDFAFIRKRIPSLPASSD